MAAIVIPTWAVWLISLVGVGWCAWVTRSLTKILSTSQLTGPMQEMLFAHVTDHDLHGAGLTVLRGRIDTLQAAIDVLRRERNQPAQ